MTLLDRNDLLPNQGFRDTQRRIVGQQPLAADQSMGDPHSCSDGGEPFEPTITVTTPNSAASAHLLDSGHAKPEPHRRLAAVDLLPPPNLGATTTQAPVAAPSPTTTRHSATTNEDSSSSGSSSSQPSTGEANIHGASDGWLELRVAADLFWRAQQERIAITNICRPKTKGGSVEPIRFKDHLVLLAAVEKHALTELKAVYRRVVPAELRAWVKATVGVNIDLFARLLGHLGDPYIAVPKYWAGTGKNRILMVEEPRIRTKAELRQYCGHGAPGRIRRGITADELAALGSPTLKMLVHLIAERAAMQTGEPVTYETGKLAGRTVQRRRSPYRDIYDAEKDRTLGKTHTTTCVRCGPSGHPAEVGTPWSDGHRHAHAQRVVGRQILEDIWLVRHRAEGGAA